jgi:zinc resistance-associated protein
MKRTLFCALTAVAISASSFALTAGIAAGDQSAEAAHQERMQHWAADHEVMMDAGLGGMKAALKLTPDQNPLWEAFEDAVRGAGKSRADDMRQMMENRERMSIVERTGAAADHMARRADALKKISEAARPLYGSFDDTQKHKFELVDREMMMTASLPGTEELGGDAGSAWVPGHWDSAQNLDPERGLGYKGVP